MNFLIFRGFSRFSEFIFDFQMIKKIIKKKEEKGVNILAGPGGCDVALRSTWQRHADPRKHLRCADVTCIFIFIVIIGL